MMRHYYSVRTEVVVDQCAGCGGYWLDAGELQSIREQFATQSDREDARAVDYQRTVGRDVDDSIRNDEPPDPLGRRLLWLLGRS